MPLCSVGWEPTLRLDGDVFGREAGPRIREFGSLDPGNTIDALAGA